MPEFFIDGKPFQYENGQTVIQAARANGIDIPHFCWHPELSVPGNCRICMVEIEADGGAWFDIACNMPVTSGMRVLTDSPKVRELRKDTMQFITLNHPVDCGICNKSGECILQDFHYEHNGSASMSIDAKNKATKFFPLSKRIMLDNERCIMCTLCVRFTNEVSKSGALGVINRGDHTLIRPSELNTFDDDAYSDNVIDLCPVGALLSRDLLDHARVWYLKATPSVCPGCARGCSINIWHRRADWRLNALDERLNTRIDRVTPLENPAVNGLWTCNKARDLATIFERPRAVESMIAGRVVDLAAATDAAAALIAASQNPVALVSTWASNEELEAYLAALAPRFRSFVKTDWLPVAGEVIEDDLLIKADKNPNRAAAVAMFPTELPPVVPAGKGIHPDMDTSHSLEEHTVHAANGMYPDLDTSHSVREHTARFNSAHAGTDTPSTALLDDADLLLVWGEGFDVTLAPPSAKIIVLDSYAKGQNATVDVFIPISIQTERSGHYTNFANVVTPFEACFRPAPGVAHAADVFAALGALVNQSAGFRA